MSGPGRVGGHLVLGVIKSAGMIATRTHDPDFTYGDDANTALVLVDRRDRFAAIMSNCLVWHTGQSTSYNDKPEPFDVDADQFDYLFFQHVRYYERHDFNRAFAVVNTIYYEDFADDAQKILPMLGIQKTHEIDPETKEEVRRLMENPAPYNFKQVILNWQDLQQRYNRHLGT